MSGSMKDLLGDTPAAEYFPAFQSHSAPSYEAARSIQKHIGPLHEKVLAYLRQTPAGATDEQIIEALGLGPSTVRPRRIELTQRGVIKDSGRYALTKSNRRATVWTLAQSERGPYSSAPPL